MLHMSLHPAAGALSKARPMLKLRVIPCLDVKDGRVVKGVNFVSLRDAGDPVEQAAVYDAAGADELTFPRHHRQPREPRHHPGRRVAHRGAGVPAADRRRRHPLDRGHAPPAAGRHRQMQHQLRRRRAAGTGARGGDQVRQPVRRRRGRRQADRARQVVGVHPWRPPRHRHRRDRLVPPGGLAGRRRNPADQHGPRRHRNRFRPRSAARGLRRGAGAGGRLRRRRHAAAFRRGRAGRRHRAARRQRVPFRHVHHRRRSSRRWPSAGLPVRLPREAA